MVNINNILTEIKSKLSTIQNIKSLKIGFEKGIGAKDCPFIRIIAEENSAIGIKETLIFQVVYGFQNNSDLEKIYQNFYDLEKKIKDILENSFNGSKCFFINTISDYDSLQNLKAGISRFEIRDIIDL